MFTIKIKQGYVEASTVFFIEVFEGSQQIFAGMATSLEQAFTLAKEGVDKA